MEASIDDWFFIAISHCLQWKKRKRLRLRNPPMASLGKLFS